MKTSSKLLIVGASIAAIAAITGKQIAKNTFVNYFGQEKRLGNEYPRGVRNNNPGNLKYTSYTASLGARTRDDKNFCVFGSYDTGYKALCQFLKDAATRQLIPYHRFNPANDYHRQLLPNGKAGDELPDLNLIDFYHIYAEDDATTKVDEPLAYALFVASKLGVDPKTLIKNLVG